MEKRLNKKLESYITSFKDSILERATQLGMSKNEEASQLIQYIYDYDRLTFNKEDFQKRKRVKNFVPIFPFFILPLHGIVIFSYLIRY
jgi:hypothetical protein